MSLWKTVENAENGWKACSGCAGDYEDPDRSAWELEEDTDEGVDGERGEQKRTTGPEELEGEEE